MSSTMTHTKVTRQAGGFHVRGLDKRIGSIPILSDITFTAMPGEILGLIGPNGAGKTTLLECLAGLLPMDNGSIYWQGSRLPPGASRRLLWYQPDDILPFARQRVCTTLSLFCRIHGAAPSELDGLAQELDLAPVLGKPLLALSKGYRRRVALAIALLSHRPLLLLDEPFDGFDLRQSLSVMKLLRHHRRGRTMLLSIHQLGEAEKICDRFLLLGEGRLLGSGSREELGLQAGLNRDATLEEVFLALT